MKNEQKYKTAKERVAAFDRRPTVSGKNLKMNRRQNP